MAFVPERPAGGRLSHYFYKVEREKLIGAQIEACAQDALRNPL
jgi:hypothetical protein